MTKKKIDEVSEQIERYRWIRDVTDEAIKQRSSKAQFHGLEQELREMQLALLDSYERTKPIPHPRDKGDHREEILRHFLNTHGLIPKKYGISSGSTRAVSQTGHVSPELDILFYEAADAVVVKRYANTLDYLPIESTHGTIQVKSKLTKPELVSGLKNIADFKSLEPGTLDQKVGGLTASTGLYSRFGILFAYEYDLPWEEIVAELEQFASRIEPRHLPNAVFVLNRGYFMFGSDERGSVSQRHLSEISNARVYGFPDHDGRCLLAFYSILMALLKESVAGTPEIDHYLRLPLTAGPHSYHYTHGAFAEVGTCPLHGKYLRSISLANIEKILHETRSSIPINWIKALDIAQGAAGDDEERYRKQPAEVKIYNPENSALSDLLIGDNGNLTFDSVELADDTVWIPLYYDDKERLIDRCPKCLKALSRARKTKATGS